MGWHVSQSTRLVPCEGGRWQGLYAPPLHTGVVLKCDGSAVCIVQPIESLVVQEAFGTPNWADEGSKLFYFIFFILPLPPSVESLVET